MRVTVSALITLASLTLCTVSVIRIDKVAEFYKSIKLANRGINDAIIDTLMELQSNMSVGFPQFGIPPLDPFHIDEANFSINDPMAKLDASLGNLHVTHLSEFVVDKVNANVLLLKVDLAVSLPLIEASGEYNIDGLIGNVIPVYGSGHFELALKEISLSAGVKLGVKDGIVSIRSLTLDFSFQHIEANFENLLGGGDFGDTINQIINEMGPDLFDQIKPHILEMAADKLISFANQQLSSVTLQDILDAIGVRRLRTLHEEMGLL